LLGSKFFPALIAVVVLGFIAIEARDARHSNADRIRQQCEKENITDVHVRECGIRLTMQTQRDDRLSLLDDERR
jgi:hypothetical protein